MNVGIDSHSAEREGEGNSTYWRGLISALVNGRGNDDFTLFAADPTHAFYGSLRGGRDPGRCASRRAAASRALVSLWAGPPRGPGGLPAHSVLCPTRLPRAPRGHGPRPRLLACARVLPPGASGRLACARAAEPGAGHAHHHRLRVLPARHRGALRHRRESDHGNPERCAGDVSALLTGRHGQGALALRPQARLRLHRRSSQSKEKPRTTHAGLHPPSGKRHGRVRLVIAGKPDFGDPSCTRRHVRV